MQPTAARRQARRLNGGRRSRGGGGAQTASTLAIALPLFLFASFLVVGAIGFIAAVSAYGYFSQGLADPAQLSNFTLSQESVIYDRTGKVELARIGDQHREVVTFAQLSPALVDATTTIEDKSFWTNTGFDPLAIINVALSGADRGASTITQQLVRERLLPADLVNDPNRRVERKIKEIIESIRLTQYFQGDTRAGKETIMADYLNGNFYGNNSYGVMAAARSYFGVSKLSQLTLAQAATLAAIPQSPSDYDLVRNGVVQDDGTLLVPDTSAIVARRNYILQLMESRLPLPLTGNQYSAADFEAAIKEPLVVVKQTQPKWIAPQFVWQVRKELSDKICGVGSSTCSTLEQGGLKIITTLDLNIQKSAEKWVKAAAIVPNSANPQATAKKLGLTYDTWMQNLRGRMVNNGALIAIDYQLGEVIAYVGSADYYSTKATKQFQPQFDVLADGWRQAGSAFKPFNYVTGINDHTMTAATMFMDVVTNFGVSGDGTPYEPTDADGFERGPLRMREALQYSLNIPAVKALQYNGVEHVFDMAKKFGLQFQTAQPTAGLSLTLGTQEVHPADLTTGYATLANGGNYIGRTTILRVIDANGKDVITAYTPPAGQQVVSDQAAYIITNILAGNTVPSINPYWGAFQITDAKGNPRPATLKTGTNNEARDLTAEGYIAPPTDAGRKKGAYALAVGVWNGNSDYSVVTDEAHPIFSLDVPTYVWQGFLDEVTKSWPITDFVEPKGLVHLSVDAWSGMRPGSFTTQTVPEIFIPGTEPTQADNLKVPAEIEKETKTLWQDGCNGTKQTVGVLDFSNVESAFPAWNEADRNWAARAAKGSGVGGGLNDGITSFFYNPWYHPYGSTWGAGFKPTKTCSTQPTPSPTPSFLPGESFPPGESLPPGASPTPIPAITVPDVTGLSVQDATTQLQNLGLNPVVIGTGSTVVGQSPAPGSFLEFGGTVQLLT